MELVGFTSLDYYSLNEEIRQGNFHEMKKNEKMYGIELIAELIKQEQYTPIQALTLLLKNCLEGQYRLEHNDRSISSISKDLIFPVRFNTGMKYLYPDIVNQIPNHFESIIDVWRQSKLQELTSDDLKKLLYFIAINHWIKYPVKSLSCIDTTKILAEIKLNENELQALLYRECILEETAQKLVYAKSIVQAYETEFDQLLRKKIMKMDILRQLIRKLQLADDPNINSEIDMNNALMEFIIQERENSIILHHQKLKIKYSPNNPEKNHDLIKIVYRTIAKNCREINTKQKLDKKDEALHEFFLSASYAYNFSTSDTGFKALQKNVIKQILTNVLIYRQRMEMELFCPNEHFWIKDMIENTNEKKSIEKLKYQLENLCITENALNNIDFKRKQISDSEMAGYHKSFIENEIQVLDNEIAYVNQQIKKLIESKFSKVNY